MSETPIIRLAAWLYATSVCFLSKKDPMFLSELEYFYKEHRSTKLPNWTADFIKRAAEAHEYMKEEGRE